MCDMKEMVLCAERFITAMLVPSRLERNTMFSALKKETTMSETDFSCFSSRFKSFWPVGG